jgi:exo-beta-1,3-glucanase (GH17 family)
MVKSLLAAALFTVLTFFMWANPNQPQAGNVPMPGGKFASVSYTPFRDGQGPSKLNCPGTNVAPGQQDCTGGPDAADVAQDLALIATQANGIRTYSSIQGNFDIGALAKQAGLKVWLGVWLSSNPKDNAREMNAAIAEANLHPDVITRVIVGNEVLLRRDLSVDALIADIDYVHARVKQPVAYADVTDFWKQFPQVAPHVDVVMIHFLPYWEDTPLSVEDALNEIQTTTNQFKAQFPGKVISIGETGWPSRGRWRGPAAPSLVNEAVFLRNFVVLANQEGVDYNLIEAFDQSWKYEDEGVAGANWGIWNAARQPKFPLSGGVVERPSWPWYAALGTLAGWLLFWSVGFRNQRLALPAFALGNGLAIACIGTLPVMYDTGLRLDALINLPLQAFFAVLVLRRADDVLAGRPLPAPTTGGDVLAALRRFRLPLNYDALWFVFLATATVFEAALVFDGRYRDAPTSVFIVPAIAAVLRFWTKDMPKPLRWEEILAANGLALLAVADSIVEGPKNLEFLIWNVCALVMAAPVVMTMEGKTKKRRAR